MDSSVITAVVTGLISGAVTCLINRWQLKNEIKKMKLSWQHLDSRSDELSMTNLLRFVSLYLNSDSEMYYDQALASISSAQPFFTNKLGTALDNLYHAVAENNHALASQYYDQVVILYRKYIH